MGIFAAVFIFALNFVEVWAVLDQAFALFPSKVSHLILSVYFEML